MFSGTCMALILLTFLGSGGPEISWRMFCVFYFFLHSWFSCLPYSALNRKLDKLLAENCFLVCGIPTVVALLFEQYATERSYYPIFHICIVHFCVPVLSLSHLIFQSEMLSRIKPVLSTVTSFILFFLPLSTSLYCLLLGLI